jgi:hypothetical protein
MRLIQTQTLTSNQATVVFSDIPANYQNLMLGISARTNRAGAAIEVLYARMNTDTASNTNYSSIRLIAATPNAPGTDNAPYFGPAGTTDGSVSNEYGNSVLTLINYTNTSFPKLGISQNWSDSGGSTTSYYWSQHSKWANNAAINRIELFPETGGNIYSGSMFSLYGLQ